MKKVLSVILSVMMVFSVFAVSAVTAMAADNVGSIESTTKQNSITVQVNGQTTTDVVYEKDPSAPNRITFTYDGDGELVGWEFNITEGQEYKVISEDGNSITIEIINGYDGEVIANAIVKFDDGETTKKSVNPNGGDKSPKTGVAAASGLAVAGAGAAILAALKKKNDAE